MRRNIKQNFITDLLASICFSFSRVSWVSLYVKIDVELTDVTYFCTSFVDVWRTFWHVVWLDEGGVMQVHRGLLPFVQRKNRYVLDGECCMYQNKCPPCFSSIFHKELELHSKNRNISQFTYSFVLTIPNTVSCWM